MQRQKHEAIYSASLTEVFAALSATLAFRRWPAAGELAGEGLPPRGFRYRCQAGTVQRIGQIVEIIRPVSITLHETLDDPPCRVLLRLRFRLDPVEAGSVLRLGLSYELDRAAQLRPRHWSRRLRQHCQRMLEFVGERLERQQSPPAANSNL